MERKKKLHIYQSQQEADEAAIAYSAHQLPIERLRETVALILRVYGVTREQLNGRGKPQIKITGRP